MVEYIGEKMIKHIICGFSDMIDGTIATFAAIQESVYIATNMESFT